MHIQYYNTPIKEHHKRVTLILYHYQVLMFYSIFTPHSSQQDTYFPFLLSPVHHIYSFVLLGKFGFIPES